MLSELYLSAGTLLKGNVYLAYDPFDDAPKEGKFDWDGFFNNLAFGLKVFAVCAALAVAAIAVGAAGIVVGAFVGAAIGALSTTVRISVEDFNSGNVRSERDAKCEIIIGTASGAITGALGASQLFGRLTLGAINTLINATGRTMLLMATEDMTFGEAFQCAFDPRVLVIDFVTGVVIDYVVDGLLGSLSGKGGAQTFDEIADPLFEGAEDGSKTISYTDYDSIYQSSIHNPDAEMVMLGKYDGGGPTSYIVQAGDEYTYFSMDDWDAIKSMYNFTDDDMFSLFNEAFLDDGIIEGKLFQFSHNPIGDMGALGKEFKYLFENNYFWDEATMTMRLR